MARSSRIVGSSSVARKDVLEVLTEDIQSHREYIQQLYRNAAIVGGFGILLAVAVGTWFLGRELNSAILQYSIDQQLEEEMARLLENRSATEVAKIATATEQATDNALERIGLATKEAGDDARNSITAATAAQISSALQEVDQYLSDQLTNEVLENAKQQLVEISQASNEDIASRLALPAGFVAAFDRPSGCPDGWTNMGAQWRGRTLVAAVRDVNDRYGFGRVGGSETHTLSVGEMPRHSHTLQGGGLWFTERLRLEEPRIAANRVSWHTVAQDGSSRQLALEEAGRSEPHNNMPPYIALYFCKKD